VKIPDLGGEETIFQKGWGRRRLKTTNEEERKSFQRKGEKRAALSK